MHDDVGTPMRSNRNAAVMTTESRTNKGNPKHEGRGFGPSGGEETVAADWGFAFQNGNP